MTVSGDEGCKWRNGQTNTRNEARSDKAANAVNEDRKGRVEAEAEVVVVVVVVEVAAQRQAGSVGSWWRRGKSCVKAVEDGWSGSDSGRGSLSLGRIHFFPRRTKPF